MSVHAASTILLTLPTSTRLSCEQILHRAQNDGFQRCDIKFPGVTNIAGISLGYHGGGPRGYTMHERPNDRPASDRYVFYFCSIYIPWHIYEIYERTNDESEPVRNRFLSFFFSLPYILHIPHTPLQENVVRHPVPSYLPLLSVQVAVASGMKHQEEVR